MEAKIVNLITLSEDDMGIGHAAQIWSFYLILWCNKSVRSKLFKLGQKHLEYFQFVF
jgi:hypothetical protein